MRVKQICVQQCRSLSQQSEVQHELCVAVHDTQRSATACHSRAEVQHKLCMAVHDLLHLIFDTACHILTGSHGVCCCVRNRTCSDSSSVSARAETCNYVCEECGTRLCIRSRIGHCSHYCGNCIVNWWLQQYDYIDRPLWVSAGPFSSSPSGGRSREAASLPTLRPRTRSA